MSSRRIELSTIRPAITTFLILSAIGFMYVAAAVLKPLALAILLSFALAPLASFIERRGVPRFLSIVLTVLLALGSLGVIGYKVGEQLTSLATHMDKDHLENNIRKKFHFLKPKQEGAIEKLSRVGTDLGKVLDQPPRVPGSTPVSIVSQPSITHWLQDALGPYVEGAGVGVFVLILVLFLIANREDLGDRIIRLFGQARVSITTRTMEEVGQRISRYLTMFAIVNSTVGLIVCIGLAAIGVPLAFLWGVLAALFRFIPYVGPASAFALPFLFSVAYFPGWRVPLEVVALFATLEILANSFFEPVIYGKTTGVTALGLLVAAMFWTWLWGTLGLLLSTPMTVCLTVLGKYVPGLSFVSTLLGEDTPLDPDVRFYQRILARDHEGASLIVETAVKQQPRDEVFDQVLVPALARAERDHLRGDIDDPELAYLQRFVGDLLDDLDGTPEVDLKSLASESKDGTPAPPEVEFPDFRACGVAAGDGSDTLVLRMLGLLLKPSRVPLTIVSGMEGPLILSDRLAPVDPDLAILSFFPATGSSAARYLVRRLRARFPSLPLLAGRWCETRDPSGVSERLIAAGATSVVFRLGEARDLVLERAARQRNPHAVDLAQASTPP